ncbi:hypothetical protein [Lysobacter enzymogenes]|uniref:hypothetical protein n=1 Tax=Lysobacter enzymogenes TaxID=69 RepID=UPI001A95F4E8|nr:hypothetical protein [Lysobacter enzymogenes]QQP97133.1 hypothetical protein JHW38_03520 [Lysobacter enzymogenes]
MNAWLVGPAMAFGVLSGWWFYLASPQQQWRAAGPWPGRGGAWPALACAAISLALLCADLGTAAAIAMWLTLLMLSATLAPFLGAWRARRRERAR